MRTRMILTYLALIALICGGVPLGIHHVEAAEKAETKANLQFATASATGNWFSMGALIAEATNEYFTTSPVTASPAPGSLGNPAIVSVGEADLGMSYGSFLVMAQNGEDPFDRPMPNLRAVASLSPTLIHVWCTRALAEDGKNTLSDLVIGKKKMVFGAMSAGKGSYFVARQMFNALGVGRLEDIGAWGAKMYYADGSDLVNAWKDRQVDAVMNLLNAPDSLVEDALISREGRLIDLGDELSKVLSEKYGFLPYVIPTGTYSKQDYDVKTLGLPLVIFARDDVDADVIYYMCKAIYENIEALRKSSGAFAEVDVSQLHLGGGVPLHEGAARYYREAGLLSK